MFNIRSLDYKFKVMLYALFILMYIISSSNCIRIIDLQTIGETYDNHLSKMERNLYKFMTPAVNDQLLIYRRQYYMYVMKANPGLFVNMNMAVYLHDFIRVYIMNNLFINNLGMLTFDQWLESQYAYIIFKNYYTSTVFLRVLCRIPPKPRNDTYEAYNGVCREFMFNNEKLYEKAINAYFEPYFLTSGYDKEDTYNKWSIVLGYLSIMKSCNYIDWLSRLYDNHILSCESYTSYTLRTIFNGKMPIPRGSIPTIYDVPDTFNTYKSLNDFDVFLDNLPYNDKLACVFMIAITNM